jgi:sugar phosphate isomerase/epimerase
MITRRDILAGLALGAVASAASATAGASKTRGAVTHAVFTKHFLGMFPDRLADTLAGIGVTAIEAPVRPGGHVDPERVADDLPRFVETMKQRGITIELISSGINAISKAQHTEEVLRTAKSLGIPRFRMNWYRYDLKQPIWPQVEALEPVLSDLVALSSEVGILPCYQNHSGTGYVGGPVWDMAFLMRKYKPTELAWCFDIMHATIEGSTSWPVEFRLIRDHLSVANFKNFAWQGKGHKDVPLGEGVVGKEYVAMLKQTGFSGVTSLYIEYLAGDVRDPSYRARAVEATKRDLAVLNSWWT